MREIKIAQQKAYQKFTRELDGKESADADADAEISKMLRGM